MAGAVFGEPLHFFVAGAVFDEPLVPLVPLFMADALFGEPPVPFLVAGALFGEPILSCFEAGGKNLKSQVAKRVAKPEIILLESNIMLNFRGRRGTKVK